MGQKPEDHLDVDREVASGSAGDGPCTGILLALGACVHSIVDTTAWSIFLYLNTSCSKGSEQPIRGRPENMRARQCQKWLSANHKAI